MLLRRVTLLSLAVLAWSAATAEAAKNNLYVPKQAVLCARSVTAGPWKNDRYCKTCNTQATIGAAEKVTVQVGGCSGQSLAKVAEFTPSSATIFQPLQTTLDVTIGGDLTVAGAVAFDGGIATDTISPVSGSDVTIDGNLIVTGTSTHAGLETFNGDIATNVIEPASGNDLTLGGPADTVTVSGDLAVDGAVAFNGGIETNAITPATGTSLTLGGAGDTVTIPGDLVVEGTSTHADLETFNGDIATDLIYSTAPATTSVHIPGAGQDSTQIGAGAGADLPYCVAIGYQDKCA
jgi:hypothetical protein